MIHTPIPSAELEVFKQLKRLRVIFDVGARADVDYLDLLPNCKLHAFEPNPEFFVQLVEAVGERKAFLNNFGLGEVDGKKGYIRGIQGFIGGEAAKDIPIGDMILRMRTLDSYVKEYKINRIDFLKIDTEGYDYKVLIGGQQTIPKCRYIQYEHWNDKQEFHELLERRFDMHYIGYRNVLCVNKDLIPFKERERLKQFIEERGFKDLV